MYNVGENEGNYQYVIVREFSDHPLTAGVSEIVLFATHSLIASEEAIAQTAPETLSSLSELGGGLSVIGDLYKSTVFALAADEVWFNSAHSLESFFRGVGRILGSLPRPDLSDRLAGLRDRCRVESPGVCVSAQRGPRAPGPMRILWAARWEIPLPVIVLGGIYGGVFAVSEAAAVTAAWVMMVELVILREVSMRRLPGVMRESMMLVGGILLILGVSLASTSTTVTGTGGGGIHARDGSYLRLVDCEDQDVAEITVSRPLLQRYQRTLAAFIDGAREFCTRRGMTYLMTSTETPVETVVATADPDTEPIRPEPPTATKPAPPRNRPASDPARSRAAPTVPAAAPNAT